MKILLDTDIGSDADDAVCLAYLLAHPDCELLGVTTVSGDPDIRADLASCLTTRIDDLIPIAVGTGAPLLVEQQQPHAQQAEVLDRWPHASPTPGHAVDLMRSVIRSHPGEVMLVAIGPLTNVALLCAIDPEAVRLAKGLVLMGGDFRPSSARPEWNMFLDPHAASIVYQAPFSFVRSVPLDVTTQVALTESEVRARFTSPSLEPVLDFTRVWFRTQDLLTFHDPLAAAIVFEPSLCAFRAGRVTVDVSAVTGGLTRWTQEPGFDRHEVATTVDAPAYLQHFFDVLGT